MSMSSASTPTLQERLLRAITTAQNDDYSKPGTVERKRHCERQEAIRDAIDILSEAERALEIVQKENTRAKHEFTNVSNKLISDAIDPVLAKLKAAKTSAP